MSIRKDSAGYIINHLDRRSATDLADYLAKKKKKNAQKVLLLDRHNLAWVVSGTIERFA